MYKCLNTYEYTFPSNKSWQVCVHRVVMPQCFAHNLKTFASVGMHESVFCMYMYICMHMWGCVLRTCHAFLSVKSSPNPSFVIRYFKVFQCLNIL